MILDNELMFADDLAYNGTPSAIDLENIGAGPGEKIKIFVQGSSTLAGITGFTIKDGSSSSPSDDFMEITCTLAGNIIEVQLASDVNRYIIVELVGTGTAGTWNAGIVMEGVQTAQ
jgi:hypothetical protein